MEGVNGDIIEVFRAGHTCSLWSIVCPRLRVYVRHSTMMWYVGETTDQTTLTKVTQLQQLLAWERGYRLLLPRFLSYTVQGTACNKKLGRSLGTRLEAAHMYSSYTNMGFGISEICKLGLIMTHRYSQGSAQFDRTAASPVQEFSCRS